VCQGVAALVRKQRGPEGAPHEVALGRMGAMGALQPAAEEAEVHGGSREGGQSAGRVAADIAEGPRQGDVQAAAVAAGASEGMARAAAAGELEAASEAVGSARSLGVAAAGLAWG